MNILKRTLATAQAKSAPMIEIFVNGKAVQVPNNITLIQAISVAGIDTPRFCYHERLAVAGNCRMCLVEIEKVPKPVASCAYPLSAGMKVSTDTAMIKKAREGVMEFLLANHPLDCVICDQGGECDLQDQSMAFGSDRSRTSVFYEKRAVEDKEFGPLVKTSMNRCIHCTRCVRFANEVAGFSELGTSGRGNDMQITTFVEKPLKSELSGNIIDLCPVGALTSKPYEFKARSWELKKTESIDVLDAVGSNIRVDSRGMEVMRILPRLNESINEEWISDKTRFAYDGLKRQRLMQPLVKINGQFVACSWEKALSVVSENLKRFNPEEIEAIAGPLIDSESLFSMKMFMNSLGSDNLFFDGKELKNPFVFGKSIRELYLFNTGIQNIEDSDSILIIGSNPRIEATILNARIRKTWLNKDISIGLIGKKKELTYEFDYLGDSLKDLKNIQKSEFWSKFSTAQNPMIILGESCIFTPCKNEIIAEVYKIASKSNLLKGDWNGLNILPTRASFVGGNDLGWAEKERKTKGKFTWLMGADEFDISDIRKDGFIVYQGHHGDLGASIADVVLPGAAYTEKNGIYSNLEGRIQQTHIAVPPPGSAKQDWEIIRACSEFHGKPLPFDNLSSLRQSMAASIAALRNDLEKCKPEDLKKVLKSLCVADSGLDVDFTFSEAIKDYYLTDSISRASITMSKCSKELSQ